MNSSAQSRRRTLAVPALSQKAKKLLEGSPIFRTARRVLNGFRGISRKF